MSEEPETGRPAEGGWPGAFRATRRSATWATWIMCVGSALALAALGLHIFADTISTKFFHAPINGTHVIVTRYYMVALVFLPLAYAELLDSHITADLFFSALPALWQRIVLILNQVFLVGFLAVFTWQVAIKAWSQTQRGEEQIFDGVHFLIWPSRWILVLALGAMFLAAVFRLVEGLAFGRAAEPGLTGETK